MSKNRFINRLTYSTIKNTYDPAAVSSKTAALISLLLNELLYFILIISAVAVWLVILTITAVLSILGYFTLSYGIANIFLNPAVALMEMGLGIILFAVMIALWALGFQFMTSILPVISKKRNSGFKRRND